VALAHSVLSIVVAMACVLTAAADFTGQPAIVDTMERLGTSRLIPVMVAAKMLAAVGLLVGLALPQVGLVAAAGLVVYFVLAVGAHLRVRDSLADTSGALVLVVLSALTVATGWSQALIS
jgi:hypothetical protein